MYDSSNLLLYHLGVYNLSCKLCPQINEVTSVVQDHKELEAVGYWISLYMRYYDIITPFLLFSETFSISHLVAAELQILLLVHIYINYIMHICLCHILGQYPSSWRQLMESYFTRYLVRCSHYILLHCCLVCWWPYYFPFLPD